MSGFAEAVLSLSRSLMLWSPLSGEATCVSGFAFFLRMAKQSGQPQKTLGGFYKVVIHNVEVAPTAYPVKEINCQLIFSPCVNSPQLSFINMVQSHGLHIAYSASV